MARGAFKRDGVPGLASGVVALLVCFLRLRSCVVRISAPHLLEGYQRLLGPHRRSCGERRAPGFCLFRRSQKN